MNTLTDVETGTEIQFPKFADVLRHLDRAYGAEDGAWDIETRGEDDQDRFCVRVGGKLVATVRTRG